MVPLGQSGAQAIRGRGVAANPANRFETLAYQPELEDLPDPEDHGPPKPATQVYRDDSKTVLSDNDSPDLAMERSLNPYRGCEHGCPYCFARPYHEYLGMSSGLDFETKIMAKLDVAKLLRAELSHKNYQPKSIMLSSVTDCYQPIERQFRLTRQCLEVLHEFRHPVCIVTKNALVARDADILAEMARYNGIVVTLSITSLDAKLQRAMEPRASTPQARLAAMETLASAGVPVAVNAAPMVPGLTDHEIPAILEAAWKAGARRAAYTVVRLPYAVKHLFEQWLETHYPTKKDKVLDFLRDIHGGKVYDATFGKRMGGTGPRAEQIKRMFVISAKKLGYKMSFDGLSTTAFYARQPVQEDLFGL